MDLNVIWMLFVFAPLTYGKVAYGVTPTTHCTGSITIAYEDEENNVATLHLEGKRKRYPNIRIGFPVINKTDITYIEVSGECCWQIYSKRIFRGETQTVYPTEDHFYPDFQPVSLKRVHPVMTL